MKKTIHVNVWPSVREAIRAFTVPLEGREPMMYLDAHEPDGIVTTGIGCALLTPAQAAALPWLHVDGQRATPAEIREEWRHLHDDLQRLRGTRARDQRKYLTLHLADAEIEALFWQRVDATVQGVAAYFEPFEAWPAAAQCALLSMGFAMGTGRIRKEYPKMCAALDVLDFRAAAGECFMHGPGLERRNAANKALLVQAAERIERLEDVTQLVLP